MTEDSGVITITVTEPHSEDTVYKINYKKVEIKSEYGFDYTGKYHTFDILKSGNYKIELWGAQGGYSVTNGSIGGLGGLGGYTKGIINLEKSNKLYIFVGEKGTDAVIKQDAKSSYNGGGLGTWDNSDHHTCSCYFLKYCCTTKSEITGQLSAEAYSCLAGAGKIRK